MVEVCLVALYCVTKSALSNLSVDNVMFHVSCVIIIEFSAALLEHDTGDVIKMNVGGWV